MADDQDLLRLIQMNNMATGGTYDPYGTYGPYVSPVDPFGGGIVPPVTQQIGDGLASRTSVKSAYDEPLSTRAEEKYWEHVSNVPRRKEPGKWRRLGSALASLKPGQTEERLEDLRYPGYRQQISDWKLMQDALETPMIQERLENQGIRTARRYETTADIQNRRLDETIRNNQAKLEIQRIAAGDYDIKFVPGGNVWKVNKNTGEVEDTGIPSTVMDPITIAQARAEATTAGQLEVERARQANRLEAIKARGAEARLTRQIPIQNIIETITHSTVTSEMDPDDVVAARVARARELMTRDPDARSAIRINPSTGAIDISRTKGGFFGFGAEPIPDETREKWIDEIFKGPDTKTTERGGTSIRKPVPTAPNVAPAIPNAPPPTAAPTNQPSANQPIRTAPPPPQGAPALGTKHANGRIFAYRPSTNKYVWADPAAIQANPQDYIVR